MKIYVIIGEIGEYSEYEKFIIKAFFKEEEAKKYIEEANQQVCQIVSCYEEYIFSGGRVSQEYPIGFEVFRSIDPEEKLDWVTWSYVPKISFVNIELI